MKSRFFTSRNPLTNVLRSLWPKSTSPRSHDYETVRKIADFTAPLDTLPDQQIAEHTDRLRDEVQGGKEPVSPSVMLPASALVIQAMRRVMGISLYEVQILGGLALSQRAIAEMQTGEGKTFVTALPAYVQALSGKGVHVMTVNGYLAQRDYELLLPVFQMLGMTVGLLIPQASRDEKRAAYHCDITYGPGYEFGFDYLRDQMARKAGPRSRLGENYRNGLQGREHKVDPPVQRGFAYAVIDEIDSVLIDEAATPLLLSSGSSGQAANAAVFTAAKNTAARLDDGRDYILERSDNRVQLTEKGVKSIEQDGRRVAGVGLDRPWPLYVESALRAQLLLHREADYVVDRGQVMLVDGNTGRIFSDRSWRDGLHQAVQAKEGVTITSESRPLARISRQRYFQLYEGLCGLTGTAAGSEREFWDIYRLSVTPIPLHKQSRRELLTTRFFADDASKYRAVVQEALQVHQTGQPLLVGTRTIDATEILARSFEEKKLPFKLLNGKQDADEAEIVANAGQRGAITIATNMAGRGTDIKLAPGVEALGGLYVIGTEQHDSSRVDRQLVGRSARQGDPGVCRFFVSAEDRLIDLYAPKLSRRMKRLGGTDGEIPVDLSRDVVKVQQNCQHMQRLQRHKLFSHDDYLEDVLSKLARES